MCEDQTTKKTHARSGTETRAVEEKINHCAQIVQCSLLGLPAALVAVLSFSLQFLWQLISPSWRNWYRGTCLFVFILIRKFKRAWNPLT